MMQVQFCGRKEAEARTPDPGWTVISITDPGGEAALQNGWFEVLRLQFHDIDPDKILNPFLRADVVKAKPPMTPKQAAVVVAFVRRMMRSEVEGILVHCEQGVSRSAATAQWIVDRYGLLGFGSLTRLMNRWVYGLLDQVG